MAFSRSVLFGRAAVLLFPALCADAFGVVPGSIEEGTGRTACGTGETMVGLWARGLLSRGLLGHVTSLTVRSDPSAAVMR